MLARSSGSTPILLATSAVTKSLRQAATDDESVAEEKPGGWLEDAKYFLEECGASGNVAQDIVGEGCVECGVGERQCLRDVAVLEGGAVCEMAGTRERVGVANAGIIDVHAYDAAADDAGDLERVASGAATDFEDARGRRELQRLRNRVRLFARDPARLAEIITIGGETDLTIDICSIVALGAVVEVYWVVGCGHHCSGIDNFRGR
jgi:hypothetical protein